MGRPRKTPLTQDGEIVLRLPTRMLKILEIESERRGMKIPDLVEEFIDVGFVSLRKYEEHAINDRLLQAIVTDEDNSLPGE